MEQSQALHKLLESADLLKMVEDLTSAAIYQQMSQAGLIGLRLTIRNIRQAVLASHDLLSNKFINQVRTNHEVSDQPSHDNGMIGAVGVARVPTSVTSTVPGTITNTSDSTVLMTTPPLSTMLASAATNQGNTLNIAAQIDSTAAQIEANARLSLLSDPQRLQMMRKDLRASLEKIVESR